ncbi:MAG: endonuclease III [Thermoprotei archaeon]|nr:MAG: endonuclease III [Thermoprotei archaeon]
MSRRCTWNSDKLLKLYSKLREVYRPSVEDFVAWKLRSERKTPFEMLIGIVLSQNTSDKNAVVAMERLYNFIGQLDPVKVRSIDAEKLAEAIRPAGMHRRRAQLIKELAKYVIAHPDWLEKLERMDVENARRELMKMPGVGPKTADVFLLMYLNRATFPVDTHITRVAMRVGLVERGATYEKIRQTFMRLLPPEPKILAEMHVLLITHGRSICKALKPLCDRCPVRELCCTTSS